MGELRLVETTTQTVNADIVEKLEAALVRARAGDLEAMALAVVYRTGGVDASHSRSEDVGRLLGAVVLLQARVLRRLDE